MRYLAFNFLADLRLAFRQFRRAPAFALTVSLVLTVGLGATIAVFSAVYETLLKPLPYTSPERLVLIDEEMPGLKLTQLGVSPPNYDTLSAQRTLFSQTAAYYFNDFTLSGEGFPQHIDAVNASASLFSLLQVQPQLGRAFLPEEDRDGGPKAILLSDRLWRTAYQADPAILSRSLLLDGQPYRVVGVMPPWFEFPYPATQAWVPLALSPRKIAPEQRANPWLKVIARLAPGVTSPRQALAKLSADTESAFPGIHAKGSRWALSAAPLIEVQVGSVRKWLYLAFAAVACVLLIACANVTGLLLIRSKARARESSIRAALGATRTRMVQQAFAESLLFASIACLAGLGLAHWLVLALNRWSPLHPVEIEPAVYLFAAALGLFSAIVTAVAPALSAAAALTQARAVTTRAFGREALAVAQLAAAALLLVVGVLLSRNLVALLNTSPGFDAASILTATVQLPPRQHLEPAARAAFFRQLQHQLAALPGVIAASAGTALPFGYGGWHTSFEILNSQSQAAAQFNIVMPGYFDALRIPLRQGRVITEADQVANEPVVVIDEEFATRFFHGENPLGRYLFDRNGKALPKPARIVGVVGSVVASELGAPREAIVYAAHAQSPNSGMTLAIRTAVPPASLEAAVRGELQSLEKDVALFDVETLQDRIAASVRNRIFVAALLDALALIGLLLASLGLYGLLAYLVLLRRREIGIRLALGASPQQVTAMVVSQGVKLALIGIVIGLCAALAASRLIQSLLYGLHSLDSAAIAIGASFLLAAGLLAAWIPAHRAATIDPMQTLHEE